MSDAPLRLVDSAFVVTLEDGAAVVHGRRLVRVGHSARAASVVRLLEEGTTEQALREVTGGPVERFVGELASLGLVTRDPPPAQTGPFSRQYGYLTLFTVQPQGAQAALQEAHVAVVGAGGVGSVVLQQQLVLTGVRRYTLVDHDLVSEHNLNRQVFFAHHDVGEPKVEVLAREVSRLRPGTDVRPVRARVVAGEDLDAAFAAGVPDAVVSAADEPTSVATVVGEWAAERGKAVIEAAAGLGTGYAGPLYASSSVCCPSCFRAQLRGSLDDRAVELEMLTDGQRTPWSFGPANTVVSAMAAHDLAVHLAGGRPGTLDARVAVDFSDWSVSTFRAAACSHRPRPAGTPRPTS